MERQGEADDNGGSDEGWARAWEWNSGRGWGGGDGAIEVDHRAGGGRGVCSEEYSAEFYEGGLLFYIYFPAGILVRVRV